MALQSSRKTIGMFKSSKSPRVWCSSSASSARLWSCMFETWMKCAPTSDRIMEDILKIVPVLDRIIEAKGAVVPDEFYRTGRRCRHVDAKGDCTQKPDVRQRKATLKQK